MYLVKRSSHFYDQFRQISRVGVNNNTNHLLSQKKFICEIGTSFLVPMEKDRKYNGQITHKIQNTTQNMSTDNA